MRQGEKKGLVGEGCLGLKYFPKENRSLGSLNLGCNSGSFVTTGRLALAVALPWRNPNSFPTRAFHSKGAKGSPVLRRDSCETLEKNREKNNLAAIRLTRQIFICSVHNFARVSARVSTCLRCEHECDVGNNGKG